MSVIKQLEETFLLDEIGETIILDSTKLVCEVKNYPIVYDSNLRRDQNSIFNAWENICKTMIPKFSSLTTNDKIATRKRLRDRWSYMRSTFRRDVINNKVESHMHLDWIKEIKFLLPILKKPSKTVISPKNYKRRSRYRRASKNIKIERNPTPSIISSSPSPSSPPSSPIPSNDIDIALKSPITKPVLIDNQPETIDSSTSDTIISDTSDKSANLESPSSILTETLSITEIKSRNDLLVDTFMSTFYLETPQTSMIDPDQMFLLSLLQNYRLVPVEKKEALQHKFYTFLRD